MAGKYFFIALFFVNCVFAEENSFLTSLEDNVCQYANYATRFLQDFNDRNIGNSEVGKLLGYEHYKPNYNEETGVGRKGKSMKKMSMALMPLLFHVGASSTWMLITTLLAAKSVAIGLLLLVFKIAVSSAKVASFFTSLKAKHHNEYSWSPPVEHGHYRSLNELDHPPSDWHAPPHHHSYTPNTYTPEWINEPPINEYKTIPMYDERASKDFLETKDIGKGRQI